MASPFITQKSIVLIKSESTYGTDPTPVVATDAILTRIPNITPDIQLLDRNNTGQSMSPFSPVPGRKLYRLNFEAELKSEVIAGDGNVATPLEIDDLFKSAGLIPAYTAETANDNAGFVIYTANSAPVSATSYVYTDQVLREINGAYSNLGFRFTAGEYPIMTADMVGLYVKTVDSTPGAPSYADEDPIMVESISLTLDSFAVVCPEFEFNLNNQINEYRDVNSPNGMKRLRLVDRNPTGRFRIEEPLVATKDFWAKLDSSSPFVVAFTHGTTLGKRITVGMPAFTITNVTPVDVDGLAFLDIEGTLARASDPGDDELTMKFF